MDVGELLEKKGGDFLNGSNYGGVAKLLHPSDADSFHWFPWTSADIRGLRGREMEAWELLGSRGVAPEIAENGPSYCSRQRPWDSVEIRGRKMRWKLGNCKGG